MTTPYRIAVFGSSLTPPGTEAYEEARALGRLLGQAGYEVWNGGYLGTMGAVSQGVREVGGRSVGVTIRAWDALHPGNEWLSEKLAAEDLHDRLRHLTGVDAAIALHGGIGTLTEVALFWSLSQLSRLATLHGHEAHSGVPAEVIAKRPGGEARPLLLVGPQWAALLEAACATLAIGPGDRELVTLVDSIDGCVPLLRQRLP